jgi:hypothetical protein
MAMRLFLPLRLLRFVVVAAAVAADVAVAVEAVLAVAFAAELVVAAAFASAHRRCA